MQIEDEISGGQSALGSEDERTLANFDLLGNKSFHALAEHWDDLRGDRIMPARSDVRLAQKPLLLMRSIILRYNGPNDARIWYAGIKETANESKEMTGANLFDFMPQYFEAPFADILGTMMETPCAGIASANAKMPNGGTVDVRAASFPLCDAEGHPRFIIQLTEVKRKGVLFTTIRSFHDSLQSLSLEPIDIGAGAPDQPIRYSR